ncbi:MAG: efflux RND transporter periplasmic adaptor subunit [Pseudomonadales bacterium]
MSRFCSLQSHFLQYRTLQSNVLRFYSLAVLIISAMALLVGCEQGDAGSAPYFHRVVAQPLQRQTSYSIQRYFVGQVEARQRAELGFELSGTIAEMSVDEGVIVVAGQVLARLDSRLLRAEIQALDAQQDDILARLKLASIKIKRQRQLIDQGFASEQRIDELTAEIASLQAQLKRQQALFESAQTRLEKHTLKAPYHGEIAHRYADVGSISIPGQTVFQLLEQGTPEARVGVPARLIAKMTPGSEVLVIVAGRELLASVLAIGANVDVVTRTASVRLSLPNNESLIDGEMLYLILSERVDQEGYWVPDTALSADVRGMWNLYALVPAKQQGLYTIEARSIELLYMTGDRAFVRGAVVPGEQVLSAGLHRVVPGLTVRLNVESGE